MPCYEEAQHIQFIRVQVMDTVDQPGAHSIQVPAAPPPFPIAACCTLLYTTRTVHTFTQTDTHKLMTWL